MPLHELTQDYLDENPEIAADLAENGLGVGDKIVIDGEGSWFKAAAGDPILPPKSPPPPVLP